ncbi:alpha/beta hydrolase [Streptomyces sp. NPDC005907]|uniref:alpha/beta fold hydrolase n=1 Tax=Streptomyces sp. NPDC005907 TaxID=3154571 RepID=UPI00340D3B96
MRRSTVAHRPRDGEAARVAGLYTRRFGPWPPTEPVVVLLHGLGLSGRYFYPLARELAAVGRSVLVPDLPGSARSRAVVRRAPDTETTVRALLRWYAAAEAGPCVVVANSVGCQVAVALAAERGPRVQRLVLVGPALDATAPSAGRQLLRLLLDAPKEPLALLALVALDYLVTGAARFAGAFRQARRDALGPFTARLRAVRVPVLVVRGAGDSVAPAPWAERVAAEPSDGRLAVVPASAHAVHFSRPGLTARLIMDFL